MGRRVDNVCTHGGRWLYGEGVDDAYLHGGKLLCGEGPGRQEYNLYLLPIVLVYSEPEIKVEQAQLHKKTKMPSGKEMKVQGHPGSLENYPLPMHW